MTLRLPLALALVGLLSLSACDSGSGSDDITGTWSTTIDYKADTLIAAQNFRVVADYTTTYTFELLNTDGLIYGRITSSVDGSITGQEAGTDPVVYDLTSAESTTDYLFGTYDDPSLELDVPWGSYQENLWTFEKVGGRAELAGRVVHEWTFESLYTSQPGDFSFIIAGDQQEKTTIRRSSQDAPVLADPASIVPESPSTIHSYGDGSAALSRINVQAQ
ncbi:MAG: hypothetical protein AAF170_04500 [Bacteroidota bacterium]